MGLHDVSGASCADPAAAVARSGEAPQAICAPVSGRVVALDEVDDPVFSQGMLGRGLAIETSGSVVFSPVSGVVMADVKTKHALLIRGEGGAEVLLHVGVDTVNMRGEGFELFVERGARVKVGDPVLAFDRALMAERGYKDTVIVTVTNTDAFARVEPVCGGVVSAGSVVLRTER